MLGEDVAEMLERVRASFKVIRHVRPKLSGDACDRILQSPAPSRPIDRGLAGPGLLAHVLVSKYADHLPLYRQSEIYAREGVDLDRSTLAGWVGATSELLAPLVEAVRAHVMAASKLHADDTPVPVLAPGTGKTKIGRLWTYVRDDRPSGDTTAPAVWFGYSPDRKGENPRQHLKLYQGALQADAFAGFQQLYEGGSIQEVACWAHARRKFHEIHIAHPSPTTTEAIERIAMLYAIEAEIRGSTPEVRRAVRQVRARPLLDNMLSWLEATLAKLSRKSDTAAAIRYASSRWKALTRTSITVNSRSTITPLSVRCASLLWEGRTICFADRTPAENELPPSTRYLAQPSSTDSILNSTCTMSSSRSLIIPSPESKSCCLGT